MDELNIAIWKYLHDHNYVKAALQFKDEAELNVTYDQPFDLLEFYKNQISLLAQIQTLKQQLDNFQSKKIQRIRQGQTLLVKPTAHAVLQLFISNQQIFYFANTELRGTKSQTPLSFTQLKFAVVHDNNFYLVKTDVNSKQYIEVYNSKFQSIAKIMLEFFVVQMQVASCVILQDNLFKIYKLNLNDNQLILEIVKDIGYPALQFLEIQDQLLILTSDILINLQDSSCSIKASESKFRKCFFSHKLKFIQDQQFRIYVYSGVSLVRHFSVITSCLISVIANDSQATFIFETGNVVTLEIMTQKVLRKGIASRKSLSCSLLTIDKVFLGGVNGIYSIELE